MSRQSSKEAQELREKWEKQEVSFRRSPYFFVSLFQCCIPFFFLFGLNYLVYLFHHQTNLHVLSYVLTAPIMFLANYWGYRFLMIKLTKLVTDHYERQSPSREGTFERKFSKKKAGMESKVLRYYHLRGFAYKYPVFITKKSLFPWLVNYALNQMANNEISKNATYGDAFVGLELTKLSDGTIIMDGTAISSHVVDSLFGSLTIKKVKLEENAVVSSLTAVAPGTVVCKNNKVGPRSFCTKDWKACKKYGGFTWGTPPKNKREKTLEELFKEHQSSQ